MIASWRGLAVAAAIVLALAIALAVDLARAPGAVDRALVPGFDPDRAIELVWERPGRAAIQAVRGGERWTIAGAPADPGAIGDVLAALRGARWHRVGSPTEVHATLTVVTGDSRRALGLGEPLAGADQAWIVDGDRGLLVDSWVLRALDRDRLALQIKAPLGDASRADVIRIEDSEGAFELWIAGHPRRIGGRVPWLLAEGPARELERALGQIQIVRVPDGPVTARGLAITTAARVVLGGGCPGAPDLIALGGSAGDGCIARAAADAVDQAVARLRQPPAALIERRPIAFEPARVVLSDGVALDVRGSRVADRAADPARVMELVAALEAPAEIAALPAAPAARHIVVSDRAGAATTLDLHDPQLVVRRGEPLALRPPPGLWRLLVRPSRELRDPQPWLEEPTTITTLQIDGVTYQRGAVIGEWLRRPTAPAAIDSRAVEALVAELAAPRSLGFADGPSATAHRVSIIVAPPAGATVEHRLELAAPRPSGCPARVEGDVIVLPRALCERIAALAR